MENPADKKHNFQQLVNLLISGNPKSLGNVKDQQRNKLNTCIYNIIGMDWSGYVYNKLIINKINEIKSWNYNKMLSLPDIINNRITDVEDFVNSDDPRVKIVGIDNFKKSIDDFAIMFSGDVRAAIIQRHVDDTLNKSVSDAKSTYHSLYKLKDSIYTSLVTILGIFVAIMAAIFGGLQLFNGLFQSVSKLGFGTVISLSAITLFGIYLILLLLFNGIARLIRHQQYQFSVGFNIYLVSCFISIFLLGFLCSHPRIRISHLSYWPYRSLVLLIIVILIFICYEVWKHPTRKWLQRKKSK